MIERDRTRNTEGPKLPSRRPAKISDDVMKTKKKCQVRRRSSRRSKYATQAMDSPEAKW